MNIPLVSLSKSPEMGDLLKVLFSHSGYQFPALLIAFLKAEHFRAYLLHDLGPDCRLLHLPGLDREYVFEHGACHLRYLRRYLLRYPAQQVVKLQT